MTGLRILIVDDNATNREILRNITQTWMMESDQVEGGKQALGLLRQVEGCNKAYDIALLDWHMPGMDDYLSKPFTLQQLSTILSRWSPKSVIAVQDVSTSGTIP